MNRKPVTAIAIVIVLAISFALVGYYLANNNQADTSLVETVNNALKDYEPYSNETQYTNPDVTPSASNMYLVENGSEQLIYYGNGDTLSLYLGDFEKG